MTAPIVAEITRFSNEANIRFPYSPAVVELIKSSVPASHRSWTAVSKTWTVRDPFIDHIAGVLRRCCGEVIVRDLRQAAAPAASQFLDPDFQVLHLLPSAPRELVESAYKTLSKLVHPDRGGDPETMLRINIAVDRIRGRLSA
ncbi:MAG: hypothetical protein ACR2OO_14325 [Thermomicrobiales bacterium]